MLFSETENSVSLGPVLYLFLRKQQMSRGVDWGDFSIKLTPEWVDLVHVLNLIFKTKYFSKLKTQTKTSVPF